jgi:hypothetical protein
LLLRTILYTLFITTSALFLLTGCKSTPTHLTAEQWIADIDFFSQQLPKVHSNLFFRLSQDEFKRQIMRVKSGIDSLSDKEILFNLMRIIASVGDAHCGIDFYSRKFNLLPLHSYMCEDGLVILGAAEQYKRLIGTKIVSINNIDIGEIQHRLAPFIPHENEFWLKEKIPEYIVNADLLKFIHVTEATDQLTIGYVDNAIPHEIEVATTISHHMSCIKMMYYFDCFNLELPMAWRPGNKAYWFHYFENEQTVYFQYNQCIDKPTESFQYFTEKMFNFISRHAVSALVIDVRFNSGGNSNLFTYSFSPKLGTYLQQHDLDLFVIMGRKTFSSGFWVVTEMKQEYGALLIGEPSGNQPDHYGDQRCFTLANSRLVVDYSIRYWHLWDTSSEILNPDIRVQIYSTDILNGRDRCLEKAMELIKSELLSK